jgi:hypothetical protein
MTSLDILIEILDRLATNRGTVVMFSEEELCQWPTESVQAMIEQKLISKARPATSTVCPGCERDCIMPVHNMSGKQDSSASFIVCDKRSDINRVPVSPKRLAQCQCNLELLTGFVAARLGLRQSKRHTTSSNLREVGIVSGKKRSQMLCVKADGVLTLVAGDSELPMAELIGFEKGRFFLDPEMIYQLIDSATTADNRYTPSAARREARKLNTQAMYENWRKAYRNLRKTRPGMSDVWYSRKIARMDIGQGRNSETVRKNMKP